MAIVWHWVCNSHYNPWLICHRLQLLLLLLLLCVCVCLMHMITRIFRSVVWLWLRMRVNLKIKRSFVIVWCGQTSSKAHYYWVLLRMCRLGFKHWTWKSRYHIQRFATFLQRSCNILSTSDLIDLKVVWSARKCEQRESSPTTWEQLGTGHLLSECEWRLSSLSSAREQEVQKAPFSNAVSQTFGQLEMERRQPPARNAGRHG